MSNKPKPHYTLWQALHAALSTALKALEEVRSLRREPGPQGEPGPRGTDGLGFDDMKLSYDGARGVTVTFKRGEESKSLAIKLPIPIYRGIFKEGMACERGDMVTFGGSMFHCNKDTTDKPETSDAWQLCVKRGRDSGK